MDTSHFLHDFFSCHFFCRSILGTFCLSLQEDQLCINGIFSLHWDSIILKFFGVLYGVSCVCK